MTRHAITAAVLAIALAGCDEKNTAPATPTDLPPKFTATLLPSNEVPPVTNADSGASGTVTITLNLTTDSAGNFTAGTAEFQMTMSGFPNGTTFTGAHIHPGAPGVNNSVVINTGLAVADLTLANGSGSITKNVTLTAANLAALPTLILAPSSYYFNMHTPLNTGGAIRGQLSRTQ
jgi:endoglucanase Acf2